MSQGSGVSVTMAGVCTSDKSDKIKLREDSDDIPGVTLFQASQFTHQEFRRLPSVVLTLG